jgi:Ala-tRNA(Pro) deacylase
LEQLNISYQEFTHPAVFTCEEADLKCPPMPGAMVKNFFLRDKKGRNYFLLTLPAAKEISLHELGQLMGVKGLGFASERRLKDVLDIEPGSVGILALINDSENQTSVFIDADLLEDEWIQSHPLVNTATLAIKTEKLADFFAHTGHTWASLNI